MLTNQEINYIRSFNRHYTQVLGVLNKRTFDTNLTWPEGRILIEVAVNHLNTPIAISKALKMDKSYVSRTVKHLEAKNILVKKLSPTDSRSVNLFLTKYGQDVFRDINSKSNNLIKDMIVKLSPAEQEEFLKSIHKINDLLFRERENNNVGN